MRKLYIMSMESQASRIIKLVYFAPFESIIKSFIRFIYKFNVFIRCENRYCVRDDLVC